MHSTCVFFLTTGSDLPGPNEGQGEGCGATAESATGTLVARWSRGRLRKSWGTPSYHPKEPGYGSIAIDTMDVRG